MAERADTKPVCPVCSTEDAPPVTDCAHLRLLARDTRRHRGEWEVRRG